MSSWINISSWCIVVRTLCSWNILLYSRIYVYIMLGRDVRWYGWSFCVHSMSSWIDISSWCIVVHRPKLRERIVLLNSRIQVHIMLARDVY